MENEKNVYFYIKKKWNNWDNKLRKINKKLLAMKEKLKMADQQNPINKSLTSKLTS